MSRGRRVVVTGRGLVCSLGDDAAAVHQALREGRSGLGTIDVFDPAPLARPMGAQVREFDAKRYLGQKNMRPLDRTARLVATAAHLALGDGGWSVESRAEHAVGLVLGTMYGSVRTIAEFDRRAIEEGPIYASPLDFANTVINAAAGQTAIWHGLHGLNSTIATSQTSGLRAIAYAAGFIESGRCDVLLAGGAEELCLESFLSMERAGFLAPAGDADPVPFGPSPAGFLPGEGAALIVLESAELAARRGARVLAEVRGYGIAFDPSRGSDAEEAIRATARGVAAALAAGGMGPDDVGGVCASGMGGPLDVLVARGRAGALGPRAAALPITAIKASAGETLGADGGLQAVVGLESLRTGEQPGIRGLRSVAPEFPFPLAGTGPRALAGRSLLLHSTGWDGQRCALVISRPSES
ncbi:MAG: beta-ketoacyl synthase [Vicinamibacteria bacterium]